MYIIRIHPLKKGPFIMISEMLSCFPVWFLPILGSALALGFYDIGKKMSVDKNSVMPALFFATAAGFLVMLGATVFRGTLPDCFQLEFSFYLHVLIKALIVGSSWICIYYAMRELPVSISSPIRASSPLWTLIGALILFHEIPTLWQGVAMLLIFGGYYIFSIIGKMEGIHFTKSKGIYLIMLGTLIGSGSALYDKYLLGVLKLDREMLQFWFSADLVIVLGLAWLIRTAFGHKHPFEWRWCIPITGILLIVADWLYFYAVSVPDAQIAILSLVRRSNCLVTFAVGGLWFHDKNLKQKAIPLLLILAGVVLLALLK